MRRRRYCAPAQITLEEPVKPFPMLIGCSQREDAVTDHARAMDHQRKSVLQPTSNPSEEDIARQREASLSGCTLRIAIGQREVLRHDTNRMLVRWAGKIA